MTAEVTYNTLVIPESLATYAVGQRAICGMYATTDNGYYVTTQLSYIGFFCMLKSMTKSGIIKNYHAQVEDIKAITNLAKSTIYSYISKCKELELISVTKCNLNLVKWSKACDVFDVPCTRYVSVTYQTNNPLHKPKYVLAVVEQKVNMAAQAYSVLKKFVQNYYPADIAEGHVKQIRHLATSNPVELVTLALSKRAAWVSKFKKGVENCAPETKFDDNDNDVFLTENRHIWRGLRGMVKAFNLNPNNEQNPRRKRTVTYFKHQLENRGLATIKRNNKVYSNVGYRPAAQVFNIDGTIEKVSIKSIYSNDNKQAGMWLPDMIIPSDMFENEQKNDSKNEKKNEKMKPEKQRK
jgi:hypothetical protein